MPKETDEDRGGFQPRVAIITGAGRHERLGGGSLRLGLPRTRMPMIHAQPILFPRNPKNKDQ